MQSCKVVKNYQSFLLRYGEKFIISNTPNKENETKVGIVGTGYIARGLSYALQNDKDLQISTVLTRRKPEQVNDMAVENKQITTSVQELIDKSDIVVECSGDPIHATDVVMKRYVEPGQIITFDDIEIPESKALIAWKEIIKNKQ